MLVAVIGLVSSLLIPQILSVEGYAEYQTFLLYLSYITILHFGLMTGMSIEYAGKRRMDIDQSRYKSELRLLILILLVCSLAGVVLASTTKSKLIFYVAIMILPYCFAAGYRSLLQAWGEFKLYAVLNVLLSAIPLAIPLVVYFVSGTVSAAVCIFSYMLSYCVTALGLLLQNAYALHEVKAISILSKVHKQTISIGALFLIGNYVNNLFHSIDKQFIKIFCSVPEFSYYSFGMMMQKTMTIFITAIAQPLFPYMASGKLDKEQYPTIKRYLFMLGSLSGAAYFACAIIVKVFVPKYVNSLEIIGIFFLTFPAMAVINCLYLNLYKIRKLTKQYVWDVLLMLVFAIACNAIAIVAGTGYKGVAVATTITYYVWLLYGTKIFKELREDLREYAFLVGFALIFIITTTKVADIYGFFVFLIFDAVLCTVCFSKEVKQLAGKMKALLKKG